MRRYLFLIPCLLLPIHVAAAGSLPIRAMGPMSLKVDYTALLRGQMITKNDVPSHEQFHGLGIAYAPLPWALLKGGLGVEKLAVDRYGLVSFDGSFGIAPCGGVELRTPALVRGLLSLTVGLNASYFRSDDEKGYLYKATGLDPFWGIALEAGIVSVELGARGHWLSGNMENTRTDTDLGVFANRKVMRGYGQLVAHSPYEDNMFLTVYFDFST